MQIKHKSIFRKTMLAAAVAGLALSSTAVFADDDDKKSYTLSGPCAFLPAARATEFHGNADRAKLRLAMAGNQWVVAPQALQAFNVYIGKGDGTEPAYRENPGWTLEALNLNANRLYAQYIPPGQLVKQISSGCMTLGNDEDRNFLAGNVQVDFDVFASTNYALMRNLAKKGFVSEAVPYTKNRLDLMVKAGNPAGIGNTVITGNSEFDTQFDIIMDLLSGSIVASSLDHINEGIHKASDGYMKNAHKWVNSKSAAMGDITMTYTYADGSTVTDTMTASEWIQSALDKVATPMPGSPGANRLTDAIDNPLKGDAGEKHSGNGHDLDQNGCGKAGAYLFCEYAVLNKSNTHESRVHHVETPNGVVDAAPANGYAKVDVGFVWITEHAYQIVNGNTGVTGMQGSTIGKLGIPQPADGPKVNSNKTYSLALLATAENEKRGQQFIDFLRSPEGQGVYMDGGFTGLSDAELAASEVYDCNGDGAADILGPVSDTDPTIEAKPCN